MPGCRRSSATRSSSGRALPVHPSLGWATGGADTATTSQAHRQDSEPRLVALLRDEIEAAPGRRITFARFMERSLTEPDLGYYATSGLRPTREGDFLTAPELHPFFGRCVGRFITALWQDTGSTRPFRVREYGAGRGTLRDSIRAGLEADDPALASVLEWQALDLPGRGDNATNGKKVELVIANEYLDALPVHRVLQQDGLRESFVGWRDGWFAEVIDAPSSPALSDHLEADGVVLAEGQRAEICLAGPTWMRSLGDEAKSVLVIDYGHEAAELYGPRRMGGSLLTYREHEVGDDPFAAVGRTDLTAHVDLTALRRAASDVGLRLLGDTSQARFLSSLGLGGLLGDLGQDPATTATEYMAARSAVAHLVDPRHLGGFRVLAWTSEAVVPKEVLPGFDGAA
jgi:SAM-dependent MidA family methyltransferase